MFQFRTISMLVFFVFLALEAPFAQAQCKSLNVAVVAIRNAKTNSDRDKIVENLNLKAIVAEQLKTGKAHYLAVAGIGLEYPGLTIEVPRAQTAIVPHTGDEIEVGKSLAQHLDWTASAHVFALRYNLMMRHADRDANPDSKPPAFPLSEVQEYFMISNEAWKHLSLESTLLMQHDLIKLFRCEDESVKIRRELDALRMKLKKLNSHQIGSQ